MGVRLGRGTEMYRARLHRHLLQLHRPSLSPSIGVAASDPSYRADTYIQVLEAVHLPQLCMGFGPR